MCVSPNILFIEASLGVRNVKYKNMFRMYKIIVAAVIIKIVSEKSTSSGEFMLKIVPTSNGKTKQ